MNQREIKQSIKDNPNLTATEKIQKLNEVRAPYKEMTDEELLQLVRDFTEENGREPMQADVLYDRELKQRFGPWNRMLERAGTRPVAQSYLDKQQRRREKRRRHKEYRRQIREQAAAERRQRSSRSRPSLPGHSVSWVHWSTAWPRATRRTSPLWISISR